MKHTFFFFSAAVFTHDRTWVIFQKKKKKTRIEHALWEWEFEETEDEARFDRKRADQHRYLICAYGCANSTWNNSSYRSLTLYRARSLSIVELTFASDIWKAGWKSWKIIRAVKSNSHPRFNDRHRQANVYVSRATIIDTVLISRDYTVPELIRNIYTTLNGMYFN